MFDDLEHSFIHVNTMPTRKYIIKDIEEATVAVHHPWKG